MQPPPQYVSPFTDDTVGVPNGTKIYRLIRPDWVDWQDTTQRGGGPHIRKNAFQDYGEEHSQALGYEGPCMSIAVGKLLDGLGHDPAALPKLTGWDTYGVAILDVHEVRNVQSGKQGIQTRPEAKMQWHGIVFCLTRAKKNPPIQRELAAIAEWVVLPARSSSE